MRRIRLATAAALAVAVIAPIRCEAVIVECANCSDIVDQALSDAKQAQQYLTELQAYRLQLEQYANMVTNTVALPMQVFANVQGDIMQIRNIANAASLLTGNSGTILTRLQAAGGYVNSAAFLPQNIGNQFQVYAQTLATGANTLGRTLGVQQSQLGSYTALQSAIDAHSQTAAGQMQAIQAGNELASLTNTQLQQVQTTLVAASQEQATRDIIAADRQAAQDQQFQQFIAAPPLSTTGWPVY